MVSRRRFLAAGAAFGAARSFGQSLPDLLPASGGRRVAIVGGGWGGLTAARHLRRLAPELEVVLIDRDAVFRSLPLSNKWLVDRTPDALVQQDIASAARTSGYRAIQAEVTAIDRERRRLHTAQGALGYDWLILAAGIRHDYSPWLGDDVRAIEAVRRLYPAGFLAGELETLKRKLAEFKGGDLLMTIPPPPFRCPPAPYERAVMIAWMLKTRRIKGRLILVDAGGGMQRFNRMFAERYKDQILHLTHAPVKSIDPFRKTLSTEFDELRFDHAIIIPPQQAADLIWQAGLIGTDAAGKPGGWAGFDPLHLHAIGDERVFLVGDLLGRVSPLFGHYPKSAHMACQLGRIAAAEIAARSRGKLPEQQLPESVCHVFTDVEPMEMMRIDAHYRLRGDGLITQAVRQHEDPQPRGEDVEWARGLYKEMLGL
ncbi:MAG: FAD-dependent oxidoreductase [Rhodocyclales bacterium]|nr:FAD-dependent oxidoreductase [Rhodocyclales bacterium]